jgi:hypothetical protein
MVSVQKLNGVEGKVKKKKISPERDCGSLPEGVALSTLFLSFLLKDEEYNILFCGIEKISVIRTT